MASKPSWMIGFESPEEALKVKHRPLFRAIHEALKEWPGGASDVFRTIGRNVNAGLNQVAPNDYTHAPPLMLILDILQYTQSRRIAQELASIAGCVAVPGFADRPAISRAMAAQDLGVAMRPILYGIDDFALGFKTSADKSKARAALHKLIAAAHLMVLKLDAI